MKILVFSDTHLSQQFESDLYDYISELIKSVDQVIINGDYWDSYVCSFEDFVNSEWKKLFPILKEKNTVYLYGNHDRLQDSDQRVELFSSKQLLKYEFENKSGTKFIVEHGDLLAADFDYRHPLITKYFWWIYPQLLKLNRADNILGRIYKSFMHRGCLRRFNLISNYARQNMKDSEILVCGHSHIHKDDRKNHLLSTGPFWNKIARYLIINEKEIKLIEEPYAKLAENKK